MFLKTIFKSTEEFFEKISVILLLFGLLAEFFNITGIPLYVLSFVLLYFSKKFRRFIINPMSLIYARGTTYKITPWNPESETRWRANLKQIKIATSESIRLKNLEICRIPLIKDGVEKRTDKIVVSIKRDVGKTTYLITFDEPIPLDVNFFVSFEIERIDEIDEPQPFLEYDIEYRPSWVPLMSFWDSRRIR